jgi:hypothetical protein
MPDSSKNFFKSGFGSKVSKLSFPIVLGAFSKIPNRSAASLIAGFLF